MHRTVSYLTLQEKIKDYMNKDLKMISNLGTFLL